MANAHMKLQLRDASAKVLARRRGLVSVPAPSGGKQASPRQVEAVLLEFGELGYASSYALREALAGDPRVEAMRRTGGICAFDLVPPGDAARGYLSELQPKLRAAALERGVLLRPLGNVLYAMPPASTIFAAVLTMPVKPSGPMPSNV